MIVTIVPSDLGYPNQFTRDLLRALLRLSYSKTHFSSRRANLSLSEILRALGLRVTGPNIGNLKHHLQILAGVRIMFEHTYFEKQVGEKVKEMVNIGILSGYRFRELSSSQDSGSEKESPDDPNIGFNSNDKQKTNKKVAEVLQSGITWNEDFFDLSLQNGKNLIDFDYTFYISLKNYVAKELYLLLNKRNYKLKKFTIELRLLVFEKLGFSRNLENKLFKVRQQLKRAHQELLKHGYLKQDPIFNRQGGLEYVTYHLQPPSESKAKSDLVALSEQHNLIKEKLLQLDFTEGQIGRMFRDYDIKQIQQAIQLCQLEKNVQDPKRWIYACLKRGFDMSRLEVIQDDSNVDTSPFAEESQDEAESPEVKSAINTKIQAWINTHGTVYHDLCQKWLYGDKSGQKHPSAGKFLQQTITQVAIKQNVDPVDLVAQSPIYNAPIRSYILENYLKDQL